MRVLDHQYTPPYSFRNLGLTSRGSFTLKPASMHGRRLLPARRFRHFTHLPYPMRFALRKSRSRHGFVPENSKAAQPSERRRSEKPETARLVHPAVAGGGVLHRDVVRAAQPNPTPLPQRGERRLRARRESAKRTARARKKKGNGHAA